MPKITEPRQTNVLPKKNECSNCNDNGYSVLCKPIKRNEMLIKTIIETILYVGLASIILSGIIFSDITLSGVVLIGVIIMVIISVKATQ